MTVFLGCAVFLAMPSAKAQTSFPMLGSAFPVTVQRGKMTEVTVFTGGNGGGNIYGAYKALFEGTGITAEVVPPEKGWPARDPKSPNTVPVVDQVKVRVTIAPDAALGVREFRLGTPHHGISSVGQLVVSDEPQVTEVEPNNDLAHSQSVTLPCVVNGRLQASEDVDCYKFKVSAGQEATFAVLCARLEDKVHDLQEHADPIIALQDATGRELARNDDYYRADPLLHYRFEKAGDYIVQIRDIQYHGNPHWVYSLTMTLRPFITSVVPCAVHPGQTVALHLGGFNLGASQTVMLPVPANVPTGVWTTSLPLSGGLSNPIPLLISELPQTVAPIAPTGNKVVTASLPATTTTPTVMPRLTLPGGANGCLTTEGEIDRYTFSAKKGITLAFEVMARRLNSEMDSEIKVRDSRGQVLATNDDADETTKDSRIDSWIPPADGDYTVEVRDLAGHAGPNYFYNLSAQPVQPDFRLRCDTDRALIAPGNRTTWYLLVERQYGFAGPVTVNVTGLPAGVTASPLTIPAGLSYGTLFLSAAPDAKIDAALVQLTGTAQVIRDGKLTSVTHAVRPVTEIYMPGGGRGLLTVRTQGVAVTEPNDLEVATNLQQVTLIPGGTAKIEITLKRREDYKKPVTLDIRIQHLGQIFDDPLPPGVTIDDGASKTLLGEGETKGYITLKASGDAREIKDLPIAILANASINFVMKVWYASPPMMLSVAPPAKK